MGRAKRSLCCSNPVKGSRRFQGRHIRYVICFAQHGHFNSHFMHCPATSSTFKVNYSPYLVDLVLAGEIDPIRHKASVKEGVLTVKLFKKIPEIWGKFNITEESSVAVTDAIKSEALAAQEVLEKELQEKRRGRKAEDERFSTRKQMALEVSTL